MLLLRSVLWLLCLVFVQPVSAQVRLDARLKQLQGYPPLVFYTPDEYQLLNQVWCIEQDKRGWIWAALNNGTALVFDGIRWIQLPHPVNALARWFYYDREADRMYLGLRGRFGFFEVGTDGAIHWTMLSDRLPDPKPVFADVWRVYPIGDEILFFTRSAQFFYRPSTGTFRIHNESAPGHLAFADSGRVWTFQRGGGLYEWRDQKKVPVVVPEAVLPLNLRNVLLGQNYSWLFLSQEKGLQQVGRLSGQLIQNPALDSLNRRIVPARPYQMLRLYSGGYAIATLNAGVYVVSEGFDVEFHLDERAGLADVNVWSLFQDREKKLWFGTNFGYGWVNLNAPFEFFDKRAGVKGLVEGLAVYDGRLHAATSSGLLRWGNRQFEPVEGIPEAWSMLPIESPGGKQDLLVAAGTGLYTLSGSTYRSLYQGDEVLFFLYRQKNPPHHILIGRKRGVSIVERAPGGMVRLIPVAGIEDEIRQINESSDGLLWMEASSRGLWEVPPEALTDTSIKPVLHTVFGPQGNEAFIKTVSRPEGLIARTNEGMFRFDPVAGQFERWAIPGAAMATEDHPSQIMVKKRGIWWLGTAPYLVQRGDSLVLDGRLFGAFSRFAARTFVDETDSTLILAGNGGILRLTIDTLRWTSVPPPPVILRSYPKSGSPDSLISLWPEGHILELEFGSPLELTVSPVQFAARRAVQVRTYIEGLDTAWTVYSADSRRLLERLPPGFYQVKAQGRNEFLTEGPVALRTLRILPPWYLTLQARMVYLLLLIVLFALVVTGLRRYYSRREQELEKTVADRTADLKAEKARVESMNRLLADQTGQLRDALEQRRTLTGMVVHDLKNPIGAVRGYAELITDETTTSDEIPELAQRIVRVTQRMLQTISGLLQQDQGANDLDAEPVNLSETMLNLLGEMMVLANRKQQVIRSRIEQDCWVAMPEDRLVMVAENLISNAIKYTQKGGEILVEVRMVRENSRPPQVVLAVTDNGLGLSPDEIAGLFTKYYKGTNRPTGGESSTGLGLYAIRKTLDPHGASIAVTSAGKGRGSRFSVSWDAAQPV